MVQAHPEHEFYFFFDRKPDPLFLFSKNVHPVVLCPQARHPVLWYMFFEWSVTCALRRLKIDLFLSPDGFISLHTKVPTVDVIHDLNFEHAKANLKSSHQWYMTHFFPRYAQYATRLATVSSYSRSDIASVYNIEESKIDVVYNGSSQCYHPLPLEEQRKVRARYAGGSPYFLFVSTIHPRKNLQTLLKAFDLMVSKGGDASADLKLLVVGARAWWGEELETAYNGMHNRERVIFHGRAEQPVLAQMMASAVALVYPSRFEGFGIPVVEAFNAETPVITTTATSLPEVAGDAALLVDPDDVQGFVDAMSQLFCDSSKRDGLIARGREQRERFTWERTADALWKCMMQAWNDAKLKMCNR